MADKHLIHKSGDREDPDVELLAGMQQAATENDPNRLVAYKDIEFAHCLDHACCKPLGKTCKGYYVVESVGSKSRVDGKEVTIADMIDAHNEAIGDVLDLFTNHFSCAHRKCIRKEAKLVYWSLKYGTETDVATGNVGEVDKSIVVSAVQFRFFCKEEL